MNNFSNWIMHTSDLSGYANGTSNNIAVRNLVTFLGTYFLFFLSH